MYIPKVDTNLIFIDLKFSKVDTIRKMTKNMNFQANRMQYAF